MKYPRYKEFTLIALGLAVILGLCFYDVVFLGRTFKLTTSQAQALKSGPYGQQNNVPAFMPAHNIESSYIEEPEYQFIRNSLRQGILPLWNPHQGCGYPLIGILHLGLFFPLNFILYLFPQTCAWDILVLVRLLLCGIFTYMLMRVWRFTPAPALGAAITFMLSGPMVLLQYNTANVLLLFPLLLVSLEYLRRSPSRKNVVLTAVTVALTIFAGHPEPIFFVNGLSLFILLFRWATTRDSGKPGKILLGLAASYVLACGLAAVVLFPFIQNTLTEFWHNHPDTIGLDFMWGTRNRMVAILNPLLLQKPLAPDSFQFSEWWGGYLGVIPSALALLALARRQRKGLNYFLAALVALMIAKSYGFGFINWIGHLPILRFFIFHIHTLQPTAFLTALLAGMGIRIILAGSRVARKGLPVTLALTAIMAAYVMICPAIEAVTISRSGFLWGAGLLAGWQIILALKDTKTLPRRGIALLIITLLIVELFAYIHIGRERARRFESFPAVPYIELLRSSPQPNRSYGVLWAFFPNTASGYGVDDLGFAEGFLLKRLVGYVNNFISPDFFEKKHGGRASLDTTPLTLFPALQPYFNVLNVRTTIAPTDIQKMLPVNQLDFVKKVYDREVKIYEHPAAFPRAFIVHKALFEPDQKQLIEKMKALRQILGAIALVEHKPVPEIVTALAATPASDASQAVITRYRADEVLIEAQMENPGLLVLSDAYHPDWRVYVDGKRGEIFPTDYLIRSVFLEAGKHTVRFVFFPTEFYAGAAVSALTAAGLLALLGIRRRGPSYFTRRQATR